MDLLEWIDEATKKESPPASSSATSRGKNDVEQELEKKKKMLLKFPADDEDFAPYRDKFKEEIKGLEAELETFNVPEPKPYDGKALRNIKTVINEEIKVYKKHIKVFGRKGLIGARQIDVCLMLQETGRD